MTAVLTALKIVDLALTVAEAGTAAFTTLTESRADLQRMVAEKRNPTDAEWEALGAKVDAARQALHTD